jgi:hypothetical protein
MFGETHQGTAVMTPIPMSEMQANATITAHQSSDICSFDGEEDLFFSWGCSAAMLRLSKQSIALLTVILRKDRCNHKHLRGSLSPAGFMLD